MDIGTDDRMVDRTVNSPARFAAGEHLAARDDVDAAKITLRYIPARIAAIGIDPGAKRVRQRLERRCIQMVLRYLAFTVEAWGAGQVNSHLADPDEASARRHQHRRPMKGLPGASPGAAGAALSPGQARPHPLAERSLLPGRRVGGLGPPTSSASSRTCHLGPPLLLTPRLPSTRRNSAISQHPRRVSACRFGTGRHAVVTPRLLRSGGFMSVRQVGRRTLRYEAQPLDIYDLTADHRGVLEDVTGLIQQALSDLDPSYHRERFGHGSGVREKRRNLTALIAGKRGSGKTSLLLTLLHALDREQPHLPCEEPVAEALNGLRDRVVVLDILDFEQTPKDGNLLCALLVRIEDAMRGEMGDAWLGFDGPDWDMTAAANLQRLTTAAAFAWETTPPFKPSDADLEHYADSILQIERHRIRFNQQFRSLLVSLALACSQHTTRTNPLFLLPVDDLDLSPHRGPELLRLIRLTAAPRLFVVALADIDHLRDAVRLDLGTRWAGNACAPQHGRSSAQPADSSNSDDAWCSTLDELAERTLDKLLPPSQRMVLKPVDPWDVLAFHPASSSSAEAAAASDTEPTVAGLLAALDFGLALSGGVPPAGQPPTGPDHDSSSLGGDDTHRFAQSDLGLLLLGPDRHDRSGPRIDLFRRSLRSASDLYPRLLACRTGRGTTDDQLADLLRDVLDRPGSKVEGRVRQYGEDWLVDLSDLTFRAGTRQELPNLQIGADATTTDQDGPELADCRVLALAMRSFTLWEVEVGGTRSLVDPSPAAALVVARDLVAHRPHWRGVEDFHLPIPLQHNMTVWQVSPAATGSVETGSDSPIQIAVDWPTLLWKSPLRLEHFLTMWNHVIEQISGCLERSTLPTPAWQDAFFGRRMAVVAGFGWTASGVTALLPHHYDKIAKGITDRLGGAGARAGADTAPSDADWKWLRGLLAELIDTYQRLSHLGGDDTVGRIRSRWTSETFQWLALLVAMLSPETGLPTSVADALLQQPDTGESRGDMTLGLPGMLPILAAQVRGFRTVHIAQLAAEAGHVGADPNRIAGAMGCRWLGDPMAHPINDFAVAGADSKILCPNEMYRDTYESIFRQTLDKRSRSGLMGSLDDARGPGFNQRP